MPRRGSARRRSAWARAEDRRRSALLHRVSFSRPAPRWRASCWLATARWISGICAVGFRRRRRGADAPADLRAWAQAIRNLENAEEALRLLFGERRRLFDLLRLALEHRQPRGAVLAALRPHLSPRSAVFRHAFRVATVTAADTGIVAAYRLPHGIWLPLTSLVILQ